MMDRPPHILQIASGTVPDRRRQDVFPQLFDAVDGKLESHRVDIFQRACLHEHLAHRVRREICFFWGFLPFI